MSRNELAIPDLYVGLELWLLVGLTRSEALCPWSASSTIKIKIATVM